MSPFHWSVFGHLAQLLGPTLITAINPKLAPLAGALSNGISEAQQMPGKTGAEKLQHVLNMGNEAATAINATAGKVVVDTTNLNEAMTEAIDTTVAVVKLAHPVAVNNGVGNNLTK